MKRICGFVRTPVALALTAISLGSLPASAEDSLRQVRESAVLQARETGQLDAPIQTLTQLHQANPQDMAVLADLIVLLRRSGQNQAIAKLTEGTDLELLPDYAMLDLAKAYRDVRYFSLAASALASRKQRLGVDAELLYGVLLTEANDADKAKKSLATLDTQRLNADQLAQLAYAYRMARQPTTALQYSLAARELNPNHQEAIRESMAALIAAGALTQADKLAEDFPQLFSRQDKQNLIANQIALDIRAAVQEQNRAVDRYDYAQKNVALSQVLTQIDQQINQLQDNPILLQRALFDRIYVLRMLERMADAIRSHQAMLAQNPTLKTPNYILHALADAYLYERQPQTATLLYQQLTAPNPTKPDPELWIGLYFSYLESEKYDDAARVLAHLQQHVPAWRYVGANGQNKIANWERLGVDRLAAMDYAYRNQNEKAVAAIEALYKNAPNNMGLLNQYALLKRWRGLPRTSAEMTKLAQSAAPKDKSTRMNVAQNALELGQRVVYEPLLATLVQDFPTDTGVQRMQAEQQDRARPSMSASIRRATSPNDTIGGSASIDHAAQLRISTPWLYRHWRPFVQLEQSASDSTRHGDLAYGRVGVGTEWTYLTHRAWGLISQEQEGEGGQNVQLGWASFLNDHWFYGAQFDTFSIQAPLPAYKQGFTAPLLQLNLGWKAHESRSAYVNLQLMDIEDGNQRLMLNFGGDQIVYNSAHHTTNIGLDIGLQQNSSQASSIPYFNPKTMQGLSTSLDHEWLTWREYERHFKQHFRLTLGINQQADVGADPHWELFYGHRWAVSRTWGFHYGLGMASRAYDGKQERQSYGALGLNGVF